MGPDVAANCAAGGTTGAVVGGVVGVGWVVRAGAFGARVVVAPGAREPDPDGPAGDGVHPASSTTASTTPTIRLIPRSWPTGAGLPPGQFAPGRAETIAQ